MLAIIFVAACCSSFRTLVLIATITTLGNIFFIGDFKAQVLHTW